MKAMKASQHLLASIFLLISQLAFAFPAEHDPQLDSLFRQLKAAPDSTKIRLYLAISDWWIYDNPDSSRHYARISHDIAAENDRPALAAEALRNIGVAFRNQGAYDSARFYLESALERGSARASAILQADIYNDLGILFDEKSHNTKAIEFYLRAVKIYETENFEKGKAKVYNNLGIIYKKEEQFDKSLEYYKKALEIYTNLGSGIGVAICQGNIGAVAYELSRYDESIAHSLQSIDGYKKLGLDQYVPYSMTNIGMALVKKGGLMEAERWFTESLDLYEQYGNKKEQAFTLNSLSELYYARAEYVQALEYASQSFELAAELGAGDEVKLASKSRALALEAVNQPQRALEFWKIHTVVSDSLLRKERTRAIAELQTEYETTKKEQQIELLKAEASIRDMEIAQARQLTVSMLLLIVLILALGGIAYVQIKYRQRIREGEERKKVQEERFYAVVQTEEKERKRIAQELHDGIGQVLTAARLNLSILEGEVANKLQRPLNNAARLLNDAITEVRNISHNMMPRSLMGGGFCDAIKDTVERINSSGKVKVHLVGNWASGFSLEEEKAVGLYRVIQELLNNSLKYSEATDIYLSIARQQDGSIDISVSDNGKGFDVSTISRSTGIGWKNIYSRMEMLHGQIDVQSQPMSGTQINLKLAS